MRGLPHVVFLSPVAVAGGSFRHKPSSIGRYPGRVKPLMMMMMVMVTLAILAPCSHGLQNNTPTQTNRYKSVLFPSSANSKGQRRTRQQ